MRYSLRYLLAMLLLMGWMGCESEDHPQASENLGIEDMFSPGEDEPDVVREMYNEYGVWVRTHFNSVKELTNAILATDPIVAARGAVNLDPECKDEVHIYTKTLLSNVSKEFSNAFFPLEFYYVKEYGASHWIYQFRSLGRSRLIVMWPNQTKGTLAEVKDPQNHYYQDSVLTTNVWSYLADMITLRIENPISEFVATGKAYDNGEAYDNLRKELTSTKDTAAYDLALDKLLRDGGYISVSGSRAFRGDFADWIRLLALESYDNIKAKYLDNSPARAKKYEVFVAIIRQYNWDIQATGNKYRQKLEEYKATL